MLGSKHFSIQARKPAYSPLTVTSLRLQLTRLNVAVGPQDMDVPGWRLHRLKAALKGHWSINVNGNWRLTFKFESGDAILVDYQDYH